MQLEKEEKESVLISVKDFAERCELETLYATAKKIALSTVSISRPGLILTGYEEFFAATRVQVMGKNELTFLNSLDNDVRQKNIDIFVSKCVPCIIITRGQDVPVELLNSAKSYGVPIFRSQKITADVINELTTFLNELLAPTQSLHGIMMDIFGSGVLICGESGIGKSETALELLHRGHRLVSDDVVDLMKIKGKIYATSPAVTQYLMEIRGLGIIDIQSIFGVGAVSKRKGLDVIINLEAWKENKEYERVGGAMLTEEIFNVKIPKYLIPVTAGRNLAILIEVAVRDFRLKQAGHDTLAELTKRML